MKVLLAILAAFIATTTANASDPWKFVDTGSSDVHIIAATDTDTAGDTSAASLPASRTSCPVDYVVFGYTANRLLYRWRLATKFRRRARAIA